MFPEVEEGELRRLLHEMGQTWALQSGTGTRCCGLCACPASNLGSLAPELLSSGDLNNPRHMTQNARCAFTLSSLSQGLPVWPAPGGWVRPCVQNTHTQVYLDRKSRAAPKAPLHCPQDVLL